MHIENEPQIVTTNTNGPSLSGSIFKYFTAVSTGVLGTLALLWSFGHQESELGSQREANQNQTFSSSLENEAFNIRPLPPIEAEVPLVSTGLKMNPDFNLADNLLIGSIHRQPRDIFLGSYFSRTINESINFDHETSRSIHKILDSINAIGKSKIIPDGISVDARFTIGEQELATEATLRVYEDLKIIQLSLINDYFDGELFLDTEKGDYMFSGTLKNLPLDLTYQGHNLEGQKFNVIGLSYKQITERGMFNIDLSHFEGYDRNIFSGSASFTGYLGEGRRKVPISINAGFISRDGEDSGFLNVSARR